MLISKSVVYNCDLKSEQKNEAEVFWKSSECGPGLEWGGYDGQRKHLMKGFLNIYREKEASKQ